MTGEVNETSVDIKPRSRDVTDGIQKAASRAMLRAVGLTDDDWEKPQVGIASSWNEITPCNMSLRRLAEAAKDGVSKAVSGKGTRHAMGQWRPLRPFIPFACARPF